MSGLVDWRNKMDYKTVQGELIHLTHPLGGGMSVEYTADTSYTVCGGWPTASSLNASRNITYAKNFFAWAKERPSLEVLEAAIEDGFQIRGYNRIAHSRLLREGGRGKEAKAMVMSM